MRLSDLSEAALQYGDTVIVKDTNSKFVGLKGKIINISSISAAVRFEGMKKPVTIMLGALEKDESN